MLVTKELRYMTRSARWLFAAALLPIAACSSNTPPPVAAAPPAPPPLAAADAAFVNAAAATDAAEVSAAQLAETKSHNARIKKYAATMVTDHTQTTQQLSTIASSKGVTPDTSPNPMESDMATKLNADSGRAFDRDYARGQVASHEAAIKVYQDEIANGQDADLKQFAQTTLPTLQAHLKAARSLGFR